METGSHVHAKEGSHVHARRSKPGTNHDCDLGRRKRRTHCARHGKPGARACPARRGPTRPGVTRPLDPRPARPARHASTSTGSRVRASTVQPGTDRTDKRHPPARLGAGHNLPADATGVLVSRCHHGLAYPEGPRMAHLEHAPSRCLHANTCRSKGGRLLRRGAERGHPQVRLARDHEYRRRISVHVLCLDGPLAPDRRAHLDGSERPVPPLSSHCFAIRLPGSGQHIHRAAVADAEVRMRLPVCLGNRLVGKDRRPEMDDLLQSPTPTLSPWRQSTCRGL